MESAVVIFFGLLLLVLLIGSILGWVSHFATQTLRAELQVLRGQLEQLHNRTLAGTSRPSPSMSEPESTSPTDASLNETGEHESPIQREVAHTPQNIPMGHTAVPEPSPPATPPAWWMHLQTHWMVWLGAMCVGLAGVFLAAYSIEQDYLGPQARLSIGLFVGVLLHVAAEALRRRAKLRYEALAGLAGGASVILYATLLASVQLYDIWSTGWVFLFLAIVSLATMILALVYGPLLAIAGLVGAYAVPLLIGDTGGSLLVLLVYCFIVSSSGFWLLSRVYRPWLWALTLGGALLWWALLLQTDIHAVWLLVYLLALLMTANTLPLARVVRFRHYIDDPACDSLASFFRVDSDMTRDRVISSIILLVAYAITMQLSEYNQTAPWLWLAMTVGLWVIHRADHAFRLVPWLWVVLCLGGLSLGYLSGTSNWPSEPMTFSEVTHPTMLYTVFVALCLYAFVVHTSPGHPNLYPALSLSLSVLTPLAIFALLWVLNPHGFATEYWALVSVALGAVYADQARRRWQMTADAQVVWWFIAAHVGYSLAAVIFFEEASLTVALSAQIVSLVWLMQRFNVPILSWVLRAVVSVIIVRLTLNPWLPEYASSNRLTSDTWVFWTYGGALISVAVARRLATGLDQSVRWLEGAGLHLLVLFIAVCVRFLLYDGQVFVTQYTFIEASLYTNLLAALGIVYTVRMHRAATSATLMRMAAIGLLVAAILQYLWVALVINPIWVRFDDVSSTPLFNLLLLSFALPTVLFAMASRWGIETLRQPMRWLSAFALWWFVTLEVRHLWHGRLWWQDRVSDGELYSYSLAWLLLAVIAILLGSWKQQRGLYRGGMALLIVVIAKLFLLDLNDLTGLWRVLSFMGMGLCLLGLGWVHQLTLKRQ